MGQSVGIRCGKFEVPPKRGYRLLKYKWFLGVVPQRYQPLRLLKCQIFVYVIERLVTTEGISR